MGVSVPRYPPVTWSHLHPLPPHTLLSPHHDRSSPSQPSTTTSDIPTRTVYHNSQPPITPTHHYYHLSSRYQKWSKLSSQVLPVSPSSSFRGLAIPSRSDHPLGPSRCAVAGGIGQPLSLLLKLNPIVTELSLYDVVNAPGVSLHSWL